MGRQKEIPGTERPTLPEVDGAAEMYVKQRDARMRLTGKEKAAKQALIQVMQNHKLTHYVDQAAGLAVYLEEGPTSVKVTTAPTEKASSDEGDEE